MMQPAKTISRSELLNATIIVEGLLLLGATVWGRLAGLNLAAYLQLDFHKLLLGVVVGICMSVSAYAIYLVSRCKTFSCLSQLRQTVDQILVPLVAELKPIDMVAIALISGFCEEVFFRGVAQHQFGLPLTSVAFGLFHDPSLRNLSYSLLAIIYGLVLGILFAKTGNLWAPVAAHATHNLISFLLLRYLLKPPASST